MTTPADTQFDQKGEEGKRLDQAPDLSSGFLYFGNRLCPFAHRAWWSIEEKGLTPEYIHIDLQAAKPAWYKEKVNPLATVPTVYFDGKPVFESNLVVEYLEDKFPGKGNDLLPKSPEEKASVRFFIAQFGEKATKPLYGLLMNQDSSKTAELKAQVLSALKELNDLIKVQHSRLGADRAGPYYLGNTFSAADIAVAPFLDRFSATLPHYRGFDPLSEGGDDVALLRALFEAVKQRPAFKKTSQVPEFYIWAYRGYANPKL